MDFLERYEFASLAVSTLEDLLVVSAVLGSEVQWMVLFLQIGLKRIPM